MSDKKTLAVKAPLDTYEEVNAYAEEHDIKKSDVLRRAIGEYLDEEEDDADRARDRSVSPLSLLGVVALAIAPTLLATGYTAAGLTASGVAAIYVLLWVTAYDVLVEDALGDARDELAEVGGVIGFFRYVIRDDVVDDPDTVVERAANADVLGLGALVAAVLVWAPAAILYQVGVLETALDVIGPDGALAYLVLVVSLAYVAAILFGVSAVASLAIASARAVDTADTDGTVEA